MESDFYAYKCYILDLDNTLYNEADYLYAAYREIAHFLHKNYNLTTEKVENYLISEFTNSGRKNLFNNLIENYKLPKETLNDFLFILRNIQRKQKINLFPEMERLLNQLIVNNKFIYILTNGNVVQQKNKINQISWNGLINKINIKFANEIDPKPSPTAIYEILEECNLKKHEVVFIGDSEVDKKCAGRANIKFLHVNLFLS